MLRESIEASSMIRFLGRFIEILWISVLLVVLTTCIIFAIRPELIAAVILTLGSLVNG